MIGEVYYEKLVSLPAYSNVRIGLRLSFQGMPKAREETLRQAKNWVITQIAEEIREAEKRLLDAEVELGV